MHTLGPAYRRLWTAAASSNLGDGILLVGAPLVAVQLTRAPTLVAGVQVAATLPWLLLALHVGAIADRRGRRALLTTAALVRGLALLAVGAAVAAGWLSLPLLYVAVLAFGIGEVLSDTTSQSLVPDLVGHERLGAANGRLVGVQTVMNNFVGAPLAGVLVGVGAAAIFLGPAALYLVAAALLSRLPGAYVPPSRPAASLRADIVEGLRFLRGHRAIRSIAAIAAVMNLANAAYFSVFVLFVVGEDSPMGLSEPAYGALAAFLAAGSVTGSLLAERLEQRLGPRRVIIGGLAVICTLMLVPVLTTRPVAVAVMALLLGVASISVNVTSVSSRQRLVPTALLGRINAAHRLVAVGMMPLGAALGGVVSSLFGLRPLFATAVALQVVGIGIFHRHVTDEALRPPPVAVRRTAPATR